MRLIAIDPGTKCGWASWDGEHVESGVVDFAGYKDDSWAARWHRFLDFLASKNCPVLADVIVYEEQWHLRGKYAPLSWGWQVLILLFCHLRGVKPVAVNASTLKKWATGSGKATKQEMVGAANHRLFDMAAGVMHDKDIPPTGDTEQITDHNAADAILLMLYAREQCATERTLLRPPYGGLRSARRRSHDSTF